MSNTMPDCTIASRAATIANWDTRSSCGISRSSRCCTGSKPLTSPPTFCSSVSASAGSVSGPSPLLPALRPSQYGATVWPSGVTAPRPVMTTRFTLFLLLVDQQLNGLHHLADGVELGGRIVRVDWNLDIELLFQVEDHLDGIDRLEPQVLEP